MKNTSKLLALALGTVTAASAFAATDGPYVVSFPGSGTVTLDFAAGSTISVPKFNIGGAILDNVTISANYSGSSQLKFENLGNGNGTVSFTSRSVAFELQRPGGSGVLGDVNAIIDLGKSLSNFSFTYTGYDGSTDYAGTSGATSSLQNYSQNTTAQLGGPVVLTDASDLTAFQGAGPIVLPILNQVGYSVFGAGSSSILTPTSGSATVTVNYNYHTGVPEPKVYGAIGAVACLGLLGYRRFRSQQA